MWSIDGVAALLPENYTVHEQMTFQFILIILCSFFVIYPYLKKTKIALRNCIYNIIFSSWNDNE